MLFFQHKTESNSLNHSVLSEMNIEVSWKQSQYADITREKQYMESLYNVHLFQVTKLKKNEAELIK